MKKLHRLFFFPSYSVGFIALQVQKAIVITSEHAIKFQSQLRAHRLQEILYTVASDTKFNLKSWKHELLGANLNIDYNV